MVIYKLHRRKAISEVVAVSLLLTVTAFAIVGFYQWYSDFESTLLEEGAHPYHISTSSFKEYDIYIRNPGDENINLETIRLGKFDCSHSQNLVPGMNRINLKFNSCRWDLEKIDSITLVGDTGVHTIEYIFKEIHCYSDYNKDGTINSDDQTLFTSCMGNPSNSSCPNIAGDNQIDSTDQTEFNNQYNHLLGQTKKCYIG